MARSVPIDESGLRFAANVGVRRDCRVCGLRDRCITWGWTSPGGLWFENAVVLRPPPGCRGFEGRSADIFARFDGADADPDPADGGGPAS